jgi:hypothetical protein
MLDTHRHIQKSLFDGANVVEHLKDMIRDRFSVSEVPDGFLFFPVELGGLDLKSPFVGLLQVRESVQGNPYDLMDEYEEHEHDDYAVIKTNFDKGDTSRYYKADKNFVPEDADSFFSFAEFTRHRESFASMGQASLQSTYTKLLERPAEVPIDASVQVRQALDQLQGQGNLRGITSSWYTMDAYWKWIAQMYGPEMIQKFGGMNIVDPGLLPIGMVSFFRARRTKWQG